PPRYRWSDRAESGRGHGARMARRQPAPHVPRLRPGGSRVRDRRGLLVHLRRDANVPERRQLRGQPVHPVLTIPTTAAHNLRRSVILAACLGGLSLAVLALAGHPALGLFILLGLCLAALNSRAVQRSVVQFAASEAAHRRRRFTMNVLA